MKQKNPEPLVTPRKKQYRVSRASRTSKEPEYYFEAIRLRLTKGNPKFRRKNETLLRKSLTTEGLSQRVSKYPCPISAKTKWCNPR